MNFTELQGLRVTVDRVVYRDAREVSPEKPHCFVYYITIHNDSTKTVTIRGRKWVIHYDDGHVLAVEGDGVVGQTPTLAPGEDFSYHSQHFIEGSQAIAEGSYLGLCESGDRVVVRIPLFRMTVPD